MGSLHGLQIASVSCRTARRLFAAPPCTFTPSAASSQQIRHANFIVRPRRPYTFTQLVQLSDGSTYTMRTTAPDAIYQSTKDTRNTLLWQPNEKSLHNIELDEAGKLAAFRGRFGRGFDAATTGDKQDAAADERPDDVFADLMAEYAPQDVGAMKDTTQKKGKK